MKMKQIEQVVYQYGDEQKLMKLLYKSKEPILIKMPDFTDQFTIDYFQKHSSGYTTYSTFENNLCVAHQVGDIKEVLDGIKQNKPLRIFGQCYPKWFYDEIEKHVPLWRTIPFRPRFFTKRIKSLFFLGGKGSNTGIHFDREQPCILHLCLSGKKQLLLFTKSQSDFIYKVPFVSDSLIDFSQPLETIEKLYPNTVHAEGYEVILEKGDMLFMPRNCWHYTKYLEASSAASYVFYPKKVMQIYGCITGLFYLGYKEGSGYKICNWSIFKKYDKIYATSTGLKKILLKVLEKFLLIFLLPTISMLALISGILKPRRYY